ncbi:MAG: RES family NAD+ phosphorylase [Chloroflexi bacterium]|nr:RES family NAD+ phosphorylase [Chloroflexota bacterium]
MDTPAFPPDRPAPTAGRYHRPGAGWPLYASLEPATAWAEWSAATGGAIDPRGVTRRLWSLTVRDLPVLDLRAPETRGELGVDVEDLIGEREAAQSLAERARSMGARGMVVPSAARSGAWNLVVFPEGLASVTVGRSRRVHPKPPSDRSISREGAG